MYNTIIVLGFSNGNIAFFLFLLSEKDPNPEEQPEEEKDESAHKEIALSQNLFQQFIISDSSDEVSLMKFSKAFNLFAVAYSGVKLSAPTPQSVEGVVVPPEEEAINKGTYIIIYKKKDIQNLDEKDKTLYIKSSECPIEYPNPCVVVAMDFSEDEKYLEICAQPLTKSGFIDYLANPICVIFNTVANTIVTDWDSLRMVEWSEWSLAPAVNGKYLSICIDSSNEQEIPEEENAATDQLILTCIKLMDDKVNDLVCAGSLYGDIHLFRLNSLRIDKSSLGAMFKVQEEKKEDEKEKEEEKEKKEEKAEETKKIISVSKKNQKSNMSKARSYPGCVSLITNVEIVKQANSYYVFMSSLCDEVIIKYAITFDDANSELDYYTLVQEQALDDPFEELPSKTALNLIKADCWNPREKLIQSDINPPFKHEELIESKTGSNISLQVDWIFGRRACDRRNNLKIDYMKRLVYPSGSMIVILKEIQSSSSLKEMQKSSQYQQELLISKPNTEISCMTMNQTKKLIAFGTAENEAKVCVWDITTRTEIASVLLINASLVYVVKFHSSDRYLAVIALTQEFKQAIILIDILNQQILSYTTLLHSLPFKLRDIEFVPASGSSNPAVGTGVNALTGCMNEIVTAGVQHLSFWNIRKDYLEQKLCDLYLKNPNEGLEEEKHESSTGPFLFASETPVSVSPEDAQCTLFCTFLQVVFMSDILIAIADDGGVYLWSQNKFVNKRQGHVGPILCIDINLSDRLVATGGQDGNIILWLLREPIANAANHIPDLEKIRSLQLPHRSSLSATINSVGIPMTSLTHRSGSQAAPTSSVSSIQKSIQSLCLDSKSIIVGITDGSVFSVDIADSTGNIKPKQGEIMKIKQMVDAMDDEIPQYITFDALNNRLFCLTKIGTLAVWDVDSKRLIFTKSFQEPAQKIHRFRGSAKMLMMLDTQVLLLDNELTPIKQFILQKPNITAMAISCSETIIALGYLLAENIPEIGTYEIVEQERVVPLKIFRDEEMKIPISYIDFTLDDSYLVCADEIGHSFKVKLKLIL